MSIDDCFKIGYVSKTHGLKGEVTVVFENTIETQGLNSLFVDFNGSLVPYFIETLSDRGDKSFVKFESVNSINDAALFKGKILYLPKASRSKLKRGQFYDDEVIGFSVVDVTLGDIGIVTAVENPGVNPLLVISHSQKEILVPIDSPFIKSVNRSQKTIKLNLPEGYLEV
ncbi:MAG: 16S rRNA processing protein RimM [Bacteroidetes bacterium]|nr:16S rRNA processing protein RimM [Bacteroidota bacterium]